VCRLLVTANVVPSSHIVTLMKEALNSSETSLLSRAARRNIPEDAILLYVSYSLLFHIASLFVCNEIALKSSKGLRKIRNETHLFVSVCVLSQLSRWRCPGLN
jgi:hypothetical protein